MVRSYLVHKPENLFSNIPLSKEKNCGFQFSFDGKGQKKEIIQRGKKKIVGNVSVPTDLSAVATKSLSFNSFTSAARKAVFFSLTGVPLGGMHFWGRLV